MALLKFLKGNYSNLNNAAIAEGQVLICGDTGEMFVDVASDKRVKIGDFTVVANITALEALDATSVPTSRLYYVEEGNILARSNGTSWIQVNKQPSTEEMKTLLGLGSMAYISEVAEANLSTDLKAKVNAAAEGNHSHDNKALLDTYTQTEANLADAVAKKHAHTFVESELNKIADGDVAKWNAIEGNVKDYVDGKVEGLDYTDVAVDGEYVSAVNEVDGVISVTRKALPDYSNTYDAKGAANTAYENAKAYADGLASNYDEKGAAAGVKTELTTEINKKVTAVEGKDLIATSEIERLATLANYDDTQVKADIAKKADTEAMTTELGKKVDKVTGYSLVSDAEIARLANVDNYDDTQVKADIAKKADSATMTTELGKKVDKVDGYSLVANDEIARLAEVDNYDDNEVRGLIADRYTKEEADGKFAFKGADAYDDTEVRGLISGNTEAIATKVAQADYDVKVKALEDAIATKQDIIPANTYDAYGAASTAESNAKGYVDGKFEEANLSQYTTEQEVKDIVDGVIAGAVDGDTITGLANLVEYLNTHGGEAKEMGAAIDVLEGKVEAIEGKPAYGILSTDIAAWNNEIGAKELAGSKTTTAEVKTQIEAYGYATEADLTLAEGRIATLEAIDHDAYKAADATLKTELQGEIDADVKVVNDALEAYKTANNTEVGKKANSADVYVKTETYTKEEVEAAIAAAVSQAHTWGEF